MGHPERILAAVRAKEGQGAGVAEINRLPGPGTGALGGAQAFQGADPLIKHMEP